MKVFKSSLLFFIAAFLITACNQSPTEEVYNQPYQIGRAEGGFLDENDRFAKENLDLQAVGSLLERANNAEDFEYLLNSEENGINNLDLNDDGYADYIGVREFDDRDGNERGFSLFSMFGPDLIQEIATIIFDRNGYNNGYPGARVLLRGDEDLYGDNYYYETDWQDRNIPFVNWAYTDRNDYYNSPYYYENYPSYYEPYPVVETTVYRTRVEQYYSTPVFVQTTQPTVTQINIVSPYKDKSLKQVYANLPKPTREQVEFRKNNPKTKEFDRDLKENKNYSSVKEDKQFKDNPNKFENQERIKNDKPQQMREKPNKQERVNVQPQNQMKVERQNQPKFERQNQQRVERQQMKVERQNPVKMERPNMKPQKQENRVQPNGNGGGGGKQNGGGANKGGGNNPGGGGGNKGGGGGGKGKGKP